MDYYRVELENDLINPPRVIYIQAKSLIDGCLKVLKERGRLPESIMSAKDYYNNVVAPLSA